MDLQHLRASDGTGEAVLAHIQSVRNPGSTVLDLDNVDNWNSKAIVVTGTPNANGFISAAGMKVMYGHLNAGDFIIDGYAPGYLDNGNTTTEIAIVKMCTAWADLLVDMLEEHLQDNGKLKVTALDDFFRPSELISNFVSSGGVVAQTAGLTGSFSDIVYYIGGLRYTKTAVANKIYTASKDTYIDIGTDGVVDYTEVANGAGSPALAANHVRIAKVITSGAAITSVTQTLTDSLANPYRPIAPMRMDRVSNPYCFRAYQTSAQTIAADNWGLLQMNNKTYDPNNNFNTSTYKYTVPVTGVYNFSGRWYNTTGTNSSMIIGLFINNAETIRGEWAGPQTGANGYRGVVLATDIRLVAGDVVDLRAYPAAGTGVVGATSTDTYFTGCLVSAG